MRASFQQSPWLKKILPGWNASYFFMGSGVLFACIILLGMALFGRHTRTLALAAEAEHGRLYVSALESHVSEALAAIDSALQVLMLAIDQQSPDDGAMRTTSLIEAALHSSTRLRSISVLDAGGKVLFSSNRSLAGRQLDLAQLGLTGPQGDTMTPGRPQFVRDFDEIDGTQPAPGAGLAQAYVIPFVRNATLRGMPVRMLLAVNPGSLFPHYRAVLGAEVTNATLLDYQGNVLAGTAAVGFAVNQNHIRLPLFADLARHIEHGQFRYTMGEEDAYIVNFQAARKFPLVAMVGMSEAHAVQRWSAGAGNLNWLGALLTVVVLVYTAVLWRVMRHREVVEVALKSAKIVAEQANAARGEFLSTVSHEIRTPMNAVIGMSGLLRETALDAQQEEFTVAIEDSANALMVIIDEILDFSRIDAGKLTIEATDCHLLSLVEGSVDALAVKARKQGLRLLCFVEPDLPVTVSVDAGRLRQVLLNLIGNAVKFTPAGEVRILVRQVDRQHDLCTVRFEVADTGIGITAPVIAMLFNPFVQADGSVTRKYGGTGLGLSICKRLVELMGGHIGVDSKPGVGSTFWFELPVTVVAGSAAKVVLTEHARTAVLVVQPHRIQAHILSAYMKSWGMPVLVVDSAAQALAQQKRHLAGSLKQVVLIDSALPDMTAGVLRSALADSAPESRFILLADSDAARERAPAQGFHASLQQPLRQSTLFDALSDALERRQAVVPVVVDRREAPVPVRTEHDRGDHRLLLLVEDNLINQKLAVHQLSQMGYAVDVASNGQEALDALATVPYALVLMDCQMPVMDGFEATRRIRQSEQAGGGHIQIVAMTANAMQGDRERCLEAGMDDYLSKPIRRELLADMLAQRLPVAAAGAATPVLEAAAVSVSAPLLLDMRRLHDMFEDDVDAQHGMLDLFLSTTPPIFSQLGSAIASADFRQAGALCHRLVGSSATLGMDELAGLARSADRASHAGDLPRLKQLHEAMQPAFIRLVDLVQRMKETP
ncbi:ATP-binding protein [Actimicrobium sp. CCC2.4]|uniref:response regulator n=1 Tax=Actimicrobium sp. CCC2.4 TaxID=3048606 RepID=UPI002AC99114|nr:response regulator [Actimicrobium sp. CCC2.4]MEB0133709.1 ATP-binding protein [Actimicrobium sp. CCC2.4]WPX31257.1 ATP-binding protein [Actimicrobium sp. CCC2.4]